MTHDLKIFPKYFEEAISGAKTFEIRKDDRNYKVGDSLLLSEWDGEKFTGNSAFYLVTYILRDVPHYGLKDGFVILSIKPNWK